ncbi:MAG: hypothetical protein ACR2MQ_00790, partial [Gemmatimonadaceae bacterium]
MAALLEVLDDTSDIIPLLPLGPLGIPARRLQPRGIAVKAVTQGMAAENIDVHNDTLIIHHPRTFVKPPTSSFLHCPAPDGRGGEVRETGVVWRRNAHHGSECREVADQMI